MSKPGGKGLLLFVLFLSLSSLSFGQTFLISDGGPVYTCSGTLYDSGGESGNYSNSENYTLTVYSDNGDALLAEIVEFDTQWPDSLTIYDGPSTASPLLVTHTTSVTGTPAYLSSGDCLTFQFISNMGSNDPGFRINLSCTPDVTDYLISDGGPLNICSGNLFDSGGAVGDYGPDEDYQITVYSAIGRNVEADLLNLDLASGDSLFIYDGPTTSGTLLATLISGISPAVYTSSGTSLTFHFTSNNSGGEAAGWAASIACVPVASGYLISDGGTVNLCSGRIYDSGGQGGDYSTQENYTMSFCSEDGSAMVLDFSVFEYRDLDYFIVYDGPDISSPVLASITNSNALPGPFTSSGTCLTLQTTSNADAFVGDGFAANINCAPAVPEYLISDEGTVNTCGGTFYDSGGQGGNYGSADNYTMTFCSDDGRPLEVDFGSIDIRDGDYLYVYDGSTTSDPLLATFTSTTTVQGPFISSGTCLTFMFTADGGLTGAGFASVISCYSDPCDPDITAPVPDFGILADVTAECEVTSLSAPTATDYCEGSITGTHTATLPITAQGTTVVTWTYVDGNGNTSSQDQNVVLDDVTPPTITCAVPAALYAMDAGTCSYTVPDNSLDPTASGDNCGVVTLTNDYTGTSSLNGAVFTEGTTTVIWTADDGNGNSTTCQYDVVVDGDNEAPIISGCPVDMTVPSDTSYCGAVVSWTPPTATDNCSVTLSSSHNPGDTLPVGTTTVTYTATDGAGLTDLCSFDITVDPPAPPGISGSTSVCNLTSATYAVTDPGSHTFLWTVTEGTITGSDTNSTVDIAWDGTGQGTVTVDITSGSGCTNSNNITVDITSEAQTGTINSSSSLARR